MKTVIEYHYRGQIERGNGKPGYDWHAGFSENSAEGNPTAPWMTRAECLDDAKRRGARALFAVPPRRSIPPSDLPTKGLTYDGEASFTDDRH